MDTPPIDWADRLGRHIVGLIKQPHDAAAQISIPTLLRQMQERVAALEREVETLKRKA